ncbi:MAG: PDZ domain-containing protein [Bacteroidota bacterium]
MALAGSLAAQPAVIYGQVFHRKFDSTVKKPVAAKTTVFLMGVKSVDTDDNGGFVLDLSNCAFCTPGSSFMLRVNSQYGWGEKEIVLRSGGRQQVDLEIVENNNRLLIGTVRDPENGKFLSGIKVNAVLQNAPPPPNAISDENGIFQIPINKDGISEQQAIVLTLIDPAKKYKDKKVTVFINQYEPISVDMESAATRPDLEKNNRELAAAEIWSNVQMLDSRLLFISHALALNEADSFAFKFDTIFGTSVPGIDPDPGGSLNKLNIRTNIGSLRQALNSVMMSHKLTESLAQVFINANLPEESNTVISYLNQYQEVQNGESVLFEALDAYANANGKDTCEARKSRIALSYLLLQNKATVYYVYALRLIQALNVPPKNVEATFSNLKILRPRKLLNQTDFERQLMQLGSAYELLVMEKMKNMRALEKCRDRELEQSKKYLGTVMELTPSDTWEQVIIKARLNRDLGKPDKAIEYFKYYGETFKATDTVAEPYSRMAVKFTRNLKSLGVQGGVYLYAFVPESRIQKAGVHLGDILVSLQGQEVDGMDDVQKIFLETAPDTKVKLEVLRWNDREGFFERKQFEIPSKPMGGMFLPI